MRQLLLYKVIPFIGILNINYFLYIFFAQNIKINIYHITSYKIVNSESRPN